MLTIWEADTDLYYDACFSRDGSKLAVLNLGSFTIFDTTTFDVLGQWGLPEELSVRKIEFAPSGDRLICGCDDGVVALISTEDGQPLAKFNAHRNSYITAIAVNSTGTAFATASNAAEVRLWHIEPTVIPKKIREETLNVEDEDDEQSVSDSGSVDLANGKMQTSGSEQVAASLSGLHPKGDGATLHNVGGAADREDNGVRSQWHRRHAEMFEAQKKWRAALFHRAWLMHLHQDDAFCFDELHQCHVQFKADAPNESNVFPRVIQSALAMPRGTELPRLSEEVAMEINSDVWGRVGHAWRSDMSLISKRDLARMQDVCRRFPDASYLNTLGVLQYRIGEYDAAIASLQQADAMRRGEGAGQSSVEDLAFLALTCSATGDLDRAEKFEAEFQRLISNLKRVVKHQWLLREFRFRDGNRTLTVSLEEFNLSGTIEDPLEQLWEAEPIDAAWRIELDSETRRSGAKSLRIQGKSSEELRVSQSVAVKPLTWYRFHGWIRIRQEDESSAEMSHVCKAQFGNFDAGVFNDVVLNHSEWMPISVEFQTAISQTQVKLGFNVDGREARKDWMVWFDDLTLVEIDAE